MNENGNESAFENGNGNENENTTGNELEMNSIIEFEATFKQETISGFLDIENIDDETPLQFYDHNNQPQWHIPKNPNDMDLQYEWWADYDYLSTIFQETDIIQYLCDYSNEDKTIVLEETVSGDKVLLKINNGGDSQ